MIKVLTHAGKFHADDVLGVALVEVFIDKNINLTRIPHDAINIDNFDIILDVGKKYDGVKYFDHHQDKNLPSACKLLWDSLKLDYPSIDKLVTKVSEFDTGISKCDKFEYPRLIESLNSSNINEYYEQFNCFNIGVRFTVSLLNNYVIYDIQIKETETIIKNTNVIDGVIRLPKYCKGWSSCINGEVRPDIKRVIWPDQDDKYFVTVPNMNSESYELNGTPLKPSEYAEFVHANGFLDVVKTEDNLIKFLQENKCQMIIN